MKTKEIAVVVPFDAFASPHIPNIYRTLTVYLSYFSSVATPRVRFYNDLGTQASGKQIAERVIADRIPIVIGHVASESAQQAPALYAESETFHLVPTATQDAVVGASGKIARLCPNEGKIAKAITQDLIDRKKKVVCIAHDGTSYGERFAKNIKEACNSEGLKFGEITDAHKGPLIFCGSMAESANFVNRQRTSGRQNAIYLTDESVASQLGEKINFDPNVSMVGLPPLSGVQNADKISHLFWDLFNAIVGVNTKEFLLSLEIASHIFQINSPNRAIFRKLNIDTAFGPVSIKEGELKGAEPSIWSFKNEKLQPMNT